MKRGALLLLLSFSRGAWGQFALAAIVLMVLTFITSGSSTERARIVLLAVVGVGALAAFVAALLAIDQVAALFKERATLGQSYDVGHTGRFGRHVLGFLLALDHPLGIGPLQFRTVFPEDPHNAYLNAFVSGGSCRVEQSSRRPSRDMFSPHSCQIGGNMLKARRHANGKTMLEELHQGDCHGGRRSRGRECLGRRERRVARRRRGG